MKNKVAIIGLGYWGPKLLRNFYSLPDLCEVKYACDLNPEVLKSYPAQYPKVSFIEDYKMVLQDPEINAVAVATPVFSHFSLGKEILEAGKHLFIEKPMANSVEECSTLLHIAREKNLKITVDHTFIFTGAVQKMKEMTESRELGDLYYFDSERINMGLIRPDVNVLWDLAPHDFSILNYLVRERPVSVTAYGSSHITRDNCEIATVNLKYKSGFSAHIHVSWLSPVKIRKTILAGSKKMLLFDDLHPSEKLKVFDKGVSVELTDNKQLLATYRSGDIFIPKINEEEALQLICRDFLESIRTGRKPLVSGEEGLEVVQMLEATAKSLESSQEVML